MLTASGENTDCYVFGGFFRKKKKKTAFSIVNTYLLCENRL